jgi:hypothetical protein
MSLSKAGRSLATSSKCNPVVDSSNRKSAPLCVDLPQRDLRLVISLQSMIASGEKPFDVIFIDASKASYLAYLALVMKLSRSGTREIQMVPLRS